MPKMQKSDFTSKGTVVLLHGLLRSNQHMIKLKKALEHDGYHVYNIDYPTRVGPLETLIEIVWEKLEKEGVTSQQNVNLVGYSLGALLVRGVVNQYPLMTGRIVLLAPPNDGSEVADFHKNNPVYQWLAGPVGQQLTTGNTDLSQVLGGTLEGVEAGIIAGCQTLDPLHATLFPGPHDGKVSVFSTLLPGVKSHIVLQANHTFFPQTQSVIDETIYFLNHGYFSDAEGLEEQSSQAE